MMRLWTCNDFKGHWPVGSAAVVLAENEDRARELLDAAIKGRSLPDGLQSDEPIVEVDMGVEQAIVLCDGNY